MPDVIPQDLMPQRSSWQTAGAQVLNARRPSVLNIPGILLSIWGASSDAAARQQRNKLINSIVAAQPKTATSADIERVLISHGMDPAEAKARATGFPAPIQPTYSLNKGPGRVPTVIEVGPHPKQLPVEGGTMQPLAPETYHFRDEPGVPPARIGMRSGEVFPLKGLPARPRNEAPVVVPDPNSPTGFSYTTRNRAVGKPAPAPARGAGGLSEAQILNRVSQEYARLAKAKTNLVPGLSDEGNAAATGMPIEQVRKLKALPPTVAEWLSSPEGQAYLDWLKAFGALGKTSGGLGATSVAPAGSASGSAARLSPSSRTGPATASLPESIGPFPGKESMGKGILESRETMPNGKVRGYYRFEDGTGAFYPKR